MSERPRLDSWKEIAQHLGRDVRTVIRWEQSQDLPVHRVAGGRITRVFAYPDELDAWFRGRQPADGQPPPIDDAVGAAASEAFRRRPRVAAALVLMAVVGAAGAAWFASAGTGADRVILTGSELRALDRAGRTVWSYRYAGEALSPQTLWSYVGDLDGDRRNDVLAAVDSVQPPHTVPAVGLTRFSDTGALVWSQQVGDRYGFRGSEYGPPWAASYLTTYRSSGQTRIAWAVHHYTWWPSLLLTLNDRGERVGTFVNSGWIDHVLTTRDERYLLMSGITNSRRAYFYAVLDAARPTGHSPEPAGSETECLTCPEGDPISYIVFPRTDVGLQHAFPIHAPIIQTFDDGRVQVQVNEGPAPKAASTIYEFRSPREVERVRFSDAFWESHRALEASGKLRHADSHCPERGGLTIGIWEPGAHWMTVRVPIAR